MKKGIVPILYAFLAAVFYAVNTPFSKLLLDRVPATFMAAFLYLGAGVGVGIMYLFHWRREDKTERIGRKDIPYTVGMIILDILAPIFLMLGVPMFAIAWRRVALRRVAFCAILYIAAVGASPYITQWIHGGSPLFPAETFVESRREKVWDLTTDFTSHHNEDANRMSWTERMAYAWFSPDISVAWCKWRYGKTDFDPNLKKSPDCTGLGENFRYLMCMALLLYPLLLWRNRRVALCVAALFFAANCAPARYIGYGRYFAEILLVPPVVFLGVAYSFKVAAVRIIGMVFIALATALELSRIFAAFFLQLDVEATRQHQYESLLAQNLPRFSACPLRYNSRRK